MLVTVVTPSFNGIEYLRECVESTRSQEGPNVQVEHMIVDGGSTDGTVELARELGCTVMTGKDEGIFDAINKGSLAGRGQLLGFLGCDDMLLPGALDAVVRSYRESGRRWVVGGIRWTDGDGVSRGDLAAPPPWMSVPMAASLGWNCIMHMASYVERDFYRELGGFDKRMKYAGDYDFFLRALARAPFARVGATLAIFRRHGANQSMSITPAHRAEIERVEGEFAPAGAWKRQWNRYVMKSWLNGTNPSWFLCKRLDDLRATRGRAVAGV
jgi:glycosyltransferase involved in cell wall biosynthesis